MLGAALVEVLAASAHRPARPRSLGEPDGGIRCLLRAVGPGCGGSGAVRAGTAAAGLGDEVRDADAAVYDAGGRAAGRVGVKSAKRMAPASTHANKKPPGRPHYSSSANRLAKLLQM